MMILIWVLATFPQPPEGATGPAIDYSLAAMIGHAIQPLTAPIGFNWQIIVALIPGMAAREVAVGALGTDLRRRRRRGGGRQARPGAGRPMVARHGAGVPRLVRVRAAVRRDPGGHQARDRRLEMDGGDVRLHAGAGLCRRPSPPTRSPARSARARPPASRRCEIVERDRAARLGRQRAPQRRDRPARRVARTQRVEVARAGARCRATT